MTRCLICGEASENCLCERCRGAADLDKLCGEIIAYRPGSGTVPLWDEIIADLNDPYSFRNYAMTLASELQTPRSEYWSIMALAGEAVRLPKDKHGWLYDLFDAAADPSGLSDYERDRLRGIVLEARYTDYDYDEAEKLADQLAASEGLPWQAAANLAQYYTYTRRYKAAEAVIRKSMKSFGPEDAAYRVLGSRLQDNSARSGRGAVKKPEYMPRPREQREEIQKRYLAHLASLGILLPAPAARAGKEAIPPEEYPAPVHIVLPDFESFVAFDLETTGFGTYDVITEIGAIKVLNGEIIEREDRIFSELVKPMHGRHIPPQVEALTGITNASVAAARPICEVLPDFMAFAGELPLLGFNCRSFDSRFLTRAGRYSHVIIGNAYFDVMRYAMRLRRELGIADRRLSLGKLCDHLWIRNPRAHRAYEDAITTARVYLKLRALDPSCKA